MGLLDSLRALLTIPQQQPERSIVWPPMLPGVDNYLPWATIDGNQYGLGPLLTQTLTGPEESIGTDFAGLDAGGYKGNSVVFACMVTRQMLFSEVRFQYQRIRGGRPDELFGDQSLALLERPWPNATTGDLLTLAITDNDLAGNCFLVRRGDRLVRMRPDWVEIISGSRDPDADINDLSVELAGYAYYPGGKYRGKPEFLLPDEVCHFKLTPDPTARFRGMSWLTPVIRDIMGDSAATSHKLQFFRSGATPNMVIKRADSPSKEAFNEWVTMMREGYEGVAKAYKTMFLTAGADATVVGKDFQQMEFGATQGKGETRIAAAARIHPAIVGLSEGLQGASLNAGNFAAARRLVADGFLLPAWHNFAGSMEHLVRPPAGARLWVDTRDVPFMREDRKDAAEIQQIKATTIRTLVDAGYKPETVVKAVEAEDMSLLDHSNLFSVQLQEPGATQPEPTPAPSKNGKAPVEA